MNTIPLEEQRKVQEDFKKFLNRNKRGVDKFLQMEYNIAIKKLVASDSDKIRGNIEFIEKLYNWLEK